MEQIYPEIKIDAETAARLNGVSAKTVKRWAMCGMPHFKFGRKYLFLQSQVEAFMVRTFGENQNIYQLTMDNGQLKMKSKSRARRAG